MFDYLKLLFTLPKPSHCLVRQIDPSKRDEAFALELEEFYGAAHKNDRSGEFSSKVWDPFIRKWKEGDDLWFYRFPDKYWEKMMGRQGYVILRNGRMVGHIITIRN